MDIKDEERSEANMYLSEILQNKVAEVKRWAEENAPIRDAHGYSRAWQMTVTFLEQAGHYARDAHEIGMKRKWTASGE